MTLLMHKSPQSVCLIDVETKALLFCSPLLTMFRDRGLGREAVPERLFEGRVREGSCA